MLYIATLGCLEWMNGKKNAPIWWSGQVITLGSYALQMEVKKRWREQ